MKEKLKQIYRTTNPYFSYLKKPVKKGVILYESFFGQTMSCSPYALFRELMADEDTYGSFEHVWAVKDIQHGKKIVEKWNLQGNIRLVKYKSSEYNKCLATAEYVINNVTFPQYFRKREGQIYINTWHGIPLKKMGYDTPNGRLEVDNSVRNMLQADYLISPNKHHTDMYNEAYMLKNIYGGVIFEAGQPRCDRLFKAEKEDVINRLRAHGTRIEADKKIILYAPTWRGTVWDDPAGSIDDYIKLYEHLNSNIDTNEYQILIKPHVAVYKKWATQSATIDYIVSSDVDTNEILSVVDILISDYSSIFYDFVITGRPVLFYCNDQAEYEKYRGTEDISDKLPGPMTDDVNVLANWINDIKTISEEWKDRYDAVKAFAGPHEDGQVCKRVLDTILNNKQVENKADICKEKKKVLFFLGSLRPYGITYSMLSLLNGMDYDKYDVTLYVYKPKSDGDKERLFGIPKEVRVLVHTIAAIGSISDTAICANALAKGFQAKKKAVTPILQKEYTRMFGQTDFDYVVDFVGYSPLFSMVAACAPSGVKSIWQHNDLIADQNKVVNGKKPNKKRLDVVFSTYPDFNNVVGCSKSVMEINKKQIGGNDNYKFARNMVDIKRIDGCVCEDPAFFIDNQYTNFVNMGRMSVEKNQENLIKAFAQVCKKNDKLRLYILGDGPLRQKLEALIGTLNISDKVILTGNVTNPFAIMKKCDCFILPSLHEGQPMVILEAKTLGMPIIMSNFSTAKEIITEGGQIICDTEVSGIAMAMEKYISGEKPNADFDVNKYNEDAYREFEDAIREE